MNHLEFGVGAGAHQLEQQMVGRAHARIADRDLAGRLARRLDQIGQRLVGRILAHDDNARHELDQADRLERGAPVASIKSRIVMG